VDDLHQCLPDGAHHLAEEELDDCYLEEEELDGHLVRCVQQVRSARLVQLA
jgi:hypothetical protein